MVSYRSSAWEGKGFKYYWKDTLRNRPIMLFMIPITFILIPASCFVLKHQDETKFLELSRFRDRYIVYRDDDPRVRDIIKIDENGNRVYLEPKTK